MVSCERFYRCLVEQGVTWFAGVPDSLLKDICGFVNDHVAPKRHVITINEGAAVALATGYHLATGKVGLVYLQNSGLGNLVNPLTSLADPEVYSIPMLLLIGWRGEPRVPDEPQHRKQGRITLPFLSTLEIPWAVLPHDQEQAEACLATALATARERHIPYALVVRKGTFSKYEPKNVERSDYEMTREQAIAAVLETISPRSLIVSSTGMASREVFEYRERHGQEHASDFLTVGSMGHASHIALGIADGQPTRSVYCLDGDGAVLMHLGALATIGARQPANLKHVVLNNGAHDSVGGQPTVGLDIDIPRIALACAYRTASRVTTAEQLRAALCDLRTATGPVLLEVVVRRGARSDLGRPTRTPAENKSEFMSSLR